MANDFSRADCISAWRFESGALDADAKNVNALTLVGTPTEDTTNMMEGSCCISLAAATPQYAKITDANLVAGFPLKSGETAKIVTVSCWVRPTTVDANKRNIWSKFKTANGLRSFALVHNSTQIYLRYSLNGTSSTDLSLAFGAMTANQKYHITVSVDGIGVGGYPVYWVRIYNVTADTWYVKSGLLSAGSLYMGTAEWRIGADEDLAANCSFNGQIDEVAVFNSRLHNSEGVAIKGGAFPLTGNNIYDYLYDPTNGSDAYDGFSAWAKAFKTLKKAFYPGDIINALKSVETGQAGTCTATTGSVTVATTSDLSAVLPQYSIIRFDSDPTLYMVRSISSSAITLYRPYRGTTGSGKIVNKLTVPTVASSDGTATVATGTAANPIVVNGGINSSNNTQDGFTVVNGNGANSFFAAHMYFWNLTRLGFYYFNGPFSSYNLVDSNTDDIFFFRTGLGSVYYGSWIRVTANRIVSEIGKFPGVSCTLVNCVINDPETADPSLPGWYGVETMDTIVNRWKNAGYVGPSCYAINLNSRNWGLRFIDAIFDELVSGGNQIGTACVSATTVFCEDVVFHNPAIGTGTLFTNAAGTSYPVYGEVNLVNINGSETDHRTFVGCGLSYSFYIVTPDYSIFNTAAPSVKITLPGAAGDAPFYERHYIPCEAGIEKTVSVFLRKNSSYGSVTRPFMRLRWVTGTSPNLVHNVHDITMPDVNDSFEQVSYAVTPSIQGVIIVETYFQSAQVGAIAWYDDIGVA